MVLLWEPTAGLADPPRATSVRICWMRDHKTQLPPCFCIRKHLHVLCPSRELVTQGIIAGLGDTTSFRFQLLLAGGTTCHGQRVTPPVMFLFLSFMQPSEEMMN